MAQVMKSRYMISTTGRMPASAAPTPSPTMPASAIGVSKMRSGHFSAMPWVTV